MFVFQDTRKETRGKRGALPRTAGMPTECAAALFRSLGSGKYESYSCCKVARKVSLLSACNFRTFPSLDRHEIRRSTAYTMYMILSTRAVQQPICFQMSFANNKQFGRRSIGIRKFPNTALAICQHTWCVTLV